MKSRHTLNRIGLAVLVVAVMQPACSKDNARSPLPPEDSSNPPTFVEIVDPAPCEFVEYRMPVETYAWRTQPGRPKPVEVRRILLSTTDHGDFETTADYIRNNLDADEWSQWQPFWPPDLGTDWTSAAMPAGDYVFAIHGRGPDRVAAKEFEFDRNLLRITVADDPAPGFEFETVNRIVPPTGYQLCWTLADDACRIYDSYRYAWDVVDPSNPAWEVQWMPFVDQACTIPRPTFIGTHILTLELRDKSGHVRAVSAPLTVIP